MKVGGRAYQHYILIVIVGLAIWSGAFFAPYQFDDFITPLQDPASQSLSSFAENFFKTLRPLSKLTYALESSLGLVEAYQRRFLQFILMGLASVLMFKLLRRRIADLWIASCLTLIWFCHPIHAESFISLAGRPTMLAMVFILASLLERRGGLAVLYAFLAVISKEVALPFFLYQSYVFIRSKKWPVVYFLIPLFVVCMSVFRERLWTLIKFSWNEVPYYTHWWDGVAALSAELFYVILPWQVSVDPDFLFFPSALWFFVSVIFILALLVWAKKTKSEETRRDLLMWSLLVIPTHTLVLKLDPLALRSLSYASIMFPFLFLDLFGEKRIFRIVLPVALMAVLYCTFNFSRVYQDPLKLWSHAKENSPNKLRPVVNLSFFLVRQDRFEEAKLVIQEGLKKWPNRMILIERSEALETLIENEKLMKQGNEQ